MYTWRNFRTTADIRELENVREMTGYAIQSQYSASKKILALAEGFQLRIDPHVDIDLFYQKMFDIYTAEGFGLDNWGVILGIGRIIEAPPNLRCFGFDGSELDPFDQNTFAPDFSQLPPEYVTLSDFNYRAILLYKALANISNATAETQNRLLSVLVETGAGGFTGPAYVLEVGTMVIRWVFEQFLNPLQLAVFKVAGTLARGGGVGWQLYAINPDKVFGFDGSEMQPFVQAPFAPDKALIIGV